MTWRALGIEPIIAAVHARLENDLAAVVAEINADVSDGIQVEQPARILDFVPPVSTIVEFPTIGLLHGDGLYEDDNGWEATGVYEVGIVIFVQATDQDVLVKRLRRLTAAVMTVSIRDRTMQEDEGRWSVQPARPFVRYGPALADMPDDDKPPSAYFSWATVSVTVKQTES